MPNVSASSLGEMVRFLVSRQMGPPSTMHPIGLENFINAQGTRVGHRSPSSGVPPMPDAKGPLGHPLKLMSPSFQLYPSTISLVLNTLLKTRQSKFE